MKKQDEFLFNIGILILIIVGSIFIYFEDFYGSILFYFLAVGLFVLRRILMNQ